MRLYAGSSEQFWTDTVQNQIADKLKSAFFDYFRYNPPPSEYRSWQNSLKAVAMVFKDARLDDHGVILEYQMPMTSKRLDCIVCGEDGRKVENAVIVELKQWDKCEESGGEHEVMSWVGGANREVLHPSVQVNQYRMYLQDMQTVFYGEPDPVYLSSCCYLHNYSFTRADPLHAPKFGAVMRDSPLFSKDDTDYFKEFLRFRLEQGNGSSVLAKILESKYRPSKKLMDHVAHVIQGKPEYVLLDEQLVVYDMVLAAARKGFHDRRQTALIVKGGPGTGKSVIAINLMADLLRMGFNAHYATGSKAFTETLRKIIGQRGSAQFKYFNSYSGIPANEVDVLIMDESHRIRKTSDNRYTPKDRRTGIPQVDELLNAAKVCVFLIDDKQVVRPNEIGSVAYIREHVGKKESVLQEFDLPIQFRCNGSDAFVNWINNTLGVERTANVIWDRADLFDFMVVDSPSDLEKAIRQKVAEGHTGRLVAGFCWPWSAPNHDGSLKDDVVIGNFRRPWNAKPDARMLARNIPKASLWAYDANGMNQVGCVYTAQGFEFDYVGVIFGKDLYYNPKQARWEGRHEHSADTVVRKAKDAFLDLVKNTYRVLLSRGLKGCYVHFIDEDTRNFFLSRMG